MKIEDMLQALPTREDIASAIGLEVRTSPTGDVLTALGIFAAGIILGAGAALVLAPKAGEEMRHDIAKKIGEMGEHLHVTASLPAPSPNGPAA